MIDHSLLKKARAANAPGIEKEAFNPMTPEAMAAAQGGAPPMDPAMAGAAGAPPMDPAMAGTAGAPPMDPAMMGAAPPMDPAMAGMDPAMMGMDPSMAPPMEDPAAGGTPVTLTLEDLQQVFKEFQSGEEPEAEGDPKRATNKQIMSELTTVKDQLAALAAGMGLQLPAGEVGVEGDTAATADAGSPEDIAAVAGEMEAMGGMGTAAPMDQAMAMGLPPGEMPPEAMPKMAVDKFINTKLGQRG